MTFSCRAQRRRFTSVKTRSPPWQSLGLSCEICVAANGASVFRVWFRLGPHTFYLGVKCRMKKEKAFRRLRNYAIIITVVFVLITAAFAVVFHHAGYDRKVLQKLGLIENVAKPNYALLGWENCLQKMDYDSDVVFFGDSITRGSDFREYFTGQKIVNLGYAGDSVVGMINRIPMVAAVSPEKVFVLGGINGLTDTNIEKCVDSYALLLDGLHDALPDAEIFVQSVLPVSKEKEVTLTNQCHNTTIEQFNSKIKELAKERNLIFVDLYSLYLLDGEMNPALTKDGVHIYPEAYSIWADAIKSYMTE